MIKTLLKIIERIALVLGAIAFCLLTIVLAVYDRSSAATVTAALTVAFMAFYFLPFFESIEAFGLKAQFRNQVEEAEKLLEHLRRSAMASANISYVEAAWGDRWDAVSWRRKLKNSMPSKKILLC